MSDSRRTSMSASGGPRSGGQQQQRVSPSRSPFPAAGNGAGGTARSTTSGRRPSSSSMAPTRLVHPSEADGYISNLKGQIYLLSLENELLKKAESGAISNATGLDGTAASGVGEEGSNWAGGEPMPNTPLGMRATPLHRQQRYPDEGPPGSIGEIESMMRSKFREQSSKFEAEIAERKKAEAALATQVAAQSGLIASLRQELGTAQGLLSEQKMALQAAQQAAEAESVQRKSDSRRQQQTIKRLEREAEGIKKEVDARDLALADAKAAIAAAEAAKAAAEQVHAASIDEYAVLAAKDVAHAEQVQALKQKIDDGVAELEILRVAKQAAEARGDGLEQDVAQARAATAQACMARDEAIVVARELRARIAKMEEEARRAESDKATKRVISDVHDKKLAAVIKRVESAEAAAAQAVKERDAALDRTITTERKWAVLSAEADRLKRHATDAAKQASEEGARAGEMSEELAQTRGRVSALETTGEVDSRRVLDLEARLADETAAHVALSAEVVTLREELQRRPPLDVLAALEVSTLFQRNMEAAGAIKSLLEYAKRGNAPLRSPARS